MNSLIGVLCRFRKEDIALSCDIEGMFHQVSVKPGDRDLLRFLWFKDDDVDAQVVTYRLTVHLFAAKSSPACAHFTLEQTATKYKDDYGKEASEFVHRNFYVDDGLASVATVEEAKHLITASNALCRRGSFDLHKCTCSNREELKDLPESLRDTSLLKLNLAMTTCPLRAHWELSGA